MHTTALLALVHAGSSRGIDVVIELLDARLPGIQRQPGCWPALSAGKPALKLLNKQDLADPRAPHCGWRTSTPSPTHAPSAWTPARPPLPRA
jgi:hypothetical protein